MSLQGTFLQCKTNKRRWAKMLTVFLFPMTKNYTAYNKEEDVFKKPVFFSQIVWTLRYLCGIVLCYRR